MANISFIQRGILFELGLLLIALLLGAVIDVRPFAELRLQMGALLWGSAAVLPPAWLVLSDVHLNIRAMTRIKELIERVLLPHLRDASLWDLAVLSVFAGVCEEALFRGVIQVAWVGATTPVVGLLAASIIFGLAHAMTLGYAVFATLFGIYLGGLMLATDNLLTPIVAHTVYDFVALLALTRRQ